MCREEIWSEMAKKVVTPNKKDVTLYPSFIEDIMNKRSNKKGEKNLKMHK